MEDAHQTWEMLVGQIVGGRVFSARCIIIAKLDEHGNIPSRPWSYLECLMGGPQSIWSITSPTRSATPVPRVWFCCAGAEQQENRASRLRPFWLVTNF
jgi:hypothetical protein